MAIIVVKSLYLQRPKGVRELRRGGEHTPPPYGSPSPNLGEEQKEDLCRARHIRRCTADATCFVRLWSEFSRT